MDAAGGGPRYGAYTAQAVVSEIDGHYRTLADRDHRAIGGLSMGGFGALGLAMLYPATFGTAGAHSPALWGLPGPAIFGDATYFGQHKPLQLLHKQPATARGLRLWLDIGDRDAGQGSGRGAAPAAAARRRAAPVARVAGRPQRDLLERPPGRLPALLRRGAEIGVSVSGVSRQSLPTSAEPSGWLMLTCARWGSPILWSAG